MLYVHVFADTCISNPQVCGRFCVWMAAMQGHGLHGPSLQEDFVGYNHQTVIISESTSPFLSSTWFANLNTVYTAGKDMYVTVCTFEKRELNIWIMCVWVMNKTISRLTSGCPPPPNKNLSGLQRMPPRGLVTSKKCTSKYGKNYLNTSETTI